VIDAAFVLMKKNRDCGVVIDSDNNVVCTISKAYISDLLGTWGASFPKSNTIGNCMKSILSVSDSIPVEKFPAVTPIDTINKVVESYNGNVIILATGKNGSITGVYNV
jgi:hypothetical protein